MQSEQSPVERLLRLPEVSHQTGLGKSAIYQRVRAGTFPAPVKLGSRAATWPLSAISQWVNDQIQRGSAK